LTLLTGIASATHSASGECATDATASSSVAGSKVGVISLNPGRIAIAFSANSNV
jgi:hypothetical protein